MPSRSLADLLPDFGVAHREPVPAPVLDEEETPPTETSRPPVFDYAAAIAREVTDAQARLAKRLSDEHEAAMAVAEARHAADLAALQETLAGNAAMLINARFDAIATDVTARTSSIAARILGGLVAEDIRTRAIDAMREAIERAIADREAVRVRVRGASALCEALRVALGKRASQVDFAPGEGFDMTVTIDESVLETRLGEWSSALSEMLA